MGCGAQDRRRGVRLHRRVRGDRLQPAARASRRAAARGAVSGRRSRCNSAGSSKPRGRARPSARRWRRSGDRRTASQDSFRARWCGALSGRSGPVRAGQNAQGRRARARRCERQRGAGEARDGGPPRRYRHHRAQWRNRVRHRQGRDAGARRVAGRNPGRGRCADRERISHRHRRDSLGVCPGRAEDSCHGHGHHRHPGHRHIHRSRAPTGPTSAPATARPSWPRAAIPPCARS